METDADNLIATELRLGLPGTSSSSSDGGGGTRPEEKPPSPAAGSKRALRDTESEAPGTAGDGHDDAASLPSKAQVVGWPPVRAAHRKSAFLQAVAAKNAQQQRRPPGGLYVKVSMDGAPYLRKVDLRTCNGYRDLREALDALFTKSAASAADHRYAIAYEDKDGDLMLVGDVPWPMFISSCKKLRIIKGSEASR